MNELADPKEERLFQRVTDILSDSRSRVVRTVNTEMVNAYWRIGREIVENEQQGQERADYGALVLNRLAQRLREGGAKGFGVTNLRYMRQFFLARRTFFYEIEAARESWSVRQLERQIEAMLFERLALKGDSAKLASEGQRIVLPKDVLKDPFVVEFLELKEPASAQERKTHPPGPRTDADVRQLLRSLSAYRGRSEDHRHRPLL